MKKIFTFLVLSFFSAFLMAQKHNVSKQYVAPGDPLVEQKLTEWQDLKFGLFMHWGTYSQWGVVESWSICPEDEGWTQRRGPYGATYNGYKTAYENLQTKFNPVKFNPEKWYGVDIKFKNDAQTRVSINLQSADFRKLLSIIEHQSSYHFVYSERKVPGGCWLNRKTLTEILNPETYLFVAVKNSTIYIY
jgi:hypothetical protein